MLGKEVTARETNVRIIGKVMVPKAQIDEITKEQMSRK